MSVVIAPVFGSYTFTTGNGEPATWRDEGIVGDLTSIPVRGNDFKEKDGRQGVRGVTIEGILFGESYTSRDNLQTDRDTFKWAMRPGWRSLTLETGRHLRAEVASWTLEDNGLLYLSYSVRFKCRPYFYKDTAETTDTWNTPTTTGTHSITNVGGADALPAYKFTFSSAAALVLTLANTTTGQSFTLTSPAGANIANADVLIVDTDAQTVKLNGVNKRSYFDGDWFGLDPGANSYLLTLSGPTLSHIKTDYTARYL
jgi:hypothetical protein